MPRARTGAAEAAAAGRTVPSEVSVGQRLRARREQRGLTLRELARRLRVSPSAISKIETDKYRPSVSTLWAIVTELGISLDELFAGEQPEREAGTPGAPRPRASGDTAGRGKRMQPAASRQKIRLDSGVSWERLTAANDPGADFVFVQYDVGGSSSANDTFMRHAGREYGIVLTGKLEVTVGFETSVLGPGDSISFESTTPHRLKNVSDEPVTGIWFVIGRHRGDG